MIATQEVLMPPVATLELLAKPKADPGFRLTVEVGAPYFIGGSHEQWSCPCSLRPLYSKLVDAQGSDAFQALCLASSLLQQLLQAFLDDGGTLNTEDGANLTLEGYSFEVAVHPSARE